MCPDSELLFPHRSVRALAGLRDQEWDQLVQRVAGLPEMDQDSLSFSLLVIRMCDCLSCDMGSYKASLGCTACAQRAVAGNRDLDGKLVETLEAAKAKVVAYLNGREGGEKGP
jgi:hypothetical protein